MEENVKKCKPIKVELFGLCEGAFDHNGHLTIVNTHDDFVLKSLPARVSFGLAFKFYIQPQVEGEKILTIAILDSDGADVISPRLSAKFQLSKYEYASHIAMAINLQNVLFTKSGKYDVHLEIDGHKLDNFAFEVRNERK